MIPTSAKGLHRFTPDSAKNLPAPPVYLLQIPTRALRAVYDRELVAAGVIHYGSWALYARAKEVVQKLDIDNRDDILDLITRLMSAPEDDGDPDAAAARAATDLSDWRGIDMRLRGVDPQMRSMVAANRYYMNMAPVIAARIFIAGWENRDAVFRRGADDLMDEALTEDIDDTELNEIWVEIMSMMRPTETDLKNSASPRPSPRGPATSTAAKSRQTAAPGKSTGKVTRETRS